MERPDIARLVERWGTEAVAAGRTEVFDELLTEDALDTTGGIESRGRDVFKARCGAVRTAFSEITVKVDELIIDGDAIAWRWTLTGVHTGPFFGVAATGKRVTLQGTNFQRLRGDRIAQHWTLVDAAGAARQLSAK
jgi:steroid delta-isomerase-like uncharacterized protein